jgi:hypothetical protein
MTNHEITPEQLPPLEEFIRNRHNTVLEAARYIPELTEPFARWRAVSVISRLRETTGIANALILQALEHISYNQMPLDDEGTTLALRRDRGELFLTAERLEPIRPLPPADREPE